MVTDSWNYENEEERSMLLLSLFLSLSEIDLVDSNSGSVILGLNFNLIHWVIEWAVTMVQAEGYDKI